MQLIDLRNPIVHMTLWCLIATGGLIGLLLIFGSMTVAGREVLFASGELVAGLFLWGLMALIAAVLGGLLSGLLLWFLTFTAAVTDRTITYYYVVAWLRIGFVLGGLSALALWLYNGSGAWETLPLVSDPRPRDLWLVLVWLIVVPLIGATRFIDGLETFPSRRSAKDDS